MVATYRESDSNPKEQFYAHAAGVAGQGGSSYIDSVILRDRDIYQSSMLVCAVDGWPLAADDSLEERRYYAQNWRSDVAAVLTESGRQVEQIRYGAYGLPWGVPAGDLNADGDADAGDLSAANTLIGASQYDVRADINLDGVLNTSDTAIYPSTTLGRGVISDPATLNRKGYAGYELTGGSIADIWHVRHRVMHTGLGRWIQRDPAGYVDGANLAGYTRSNPVRYRDPRGLSVVVDPFAPRPWTLPETLVPASLPEQPEPITKPAHPIPDDPGPFPGGIPLWPTNPLPQPPEIEIPFKPTPFIDNKRLQEWFDCIRRGDLNCWNILQEPVLPNSTFGPTSNDFQFDPGRYRLGPV